MNTRHLLGALALAGTLLPAAAQTPSAEDPATRRPASPLRYESAFAGYKPWQDIRPADWRQVNDAVRAAAAQGSGHGGHAVHAGPAASAASAPMHHGSHGGHK